MTQKLTTDQKIDLILEKVIKIEQDQHELINTVGEIAILSGKTSDKLAQHCDKTDHEDAPKSFSPFKSGAFVA